MENGQRTLDSDKLKIISLAISVLLHLGLAIIFSLEINEPPKILSAKKTSAIQLVNIDVLDDMPEIPPVPPENVNMRTASIEPKQKTQPSKDIIPQILKNDGIAENIIETEDIEIAFEEIVETKSQDTSGAGETTTEYLSAKNAASLAHDYVKHNFNYISRRIQDKLVYPPQAKRTGVQGVVEIIFTIQKDGAADGVAVRASSGDSLLDAAALAAIYAASPFKPPVAPVRLVVPVVFSLR